MKNRIFSILCCIGIFLSVIACNVAVVVASTDATLSSLTVSEGTLSPSFSPSVTQYSTTVAHDTNTIILDATTTDRNATIVHGLGAYGLGEEETILTLRVRAENGATLDYTVQVIKEAPPSADASLQSIDLSEGTLSPAFEPDILDYTVRIPRGTNSIEVSAMANHAGATITSGIGQHSITADTEEVAIVILAENGISSETYTITIIRDGELSQDAALQSLSLSEGLLSPVFDSAVTEYQATVANGIEQIEIFAELRDPLAEINSGLGIHSLSVGRNTIEVEVTAQDGMTSRRYRIEITREAALSSVSTLSRIDLSVGSLSPSFRPDISQYTVSVPNDISEITLSAQTSSAEATILSGLGSHSLSVGLNALEIVVRAENGSLSSYQIDVTREAIVLSSDASLSSISLSTGTLSPSFHWATTNYTASVDYSVSSVTISATTSHSESVIELGTGTFSLSVGSNDFSIVVTAEDGQTQETYRLRITRANSTDASLSSLTVIPAGLDQSFHSTQHNYTATVPYGVSQVQVNATTSHPSAVINSGTGSHNLSVGSNTITINVTSASGSVQSSYTIDITRVAPSTDATLSSLSAGSITLDQNFSPATTLYTASVPFSVNQATISGSAVDSSAVISGGLGTQSLNVGLNTFTINVTAEDGTTELVYTLRITRDAASTDATLASLSTGSITLDQSFSPATTTYTATVPNGMTQVTIGATANDSNGVITHGLGTHGLNLGLNTFEIRVLAEDGSTETTYTIRITREAPLSSDASLLSLNLANGTLSPAFSPTVYSYSATVAYGVSEETLSASTSNSSAVITGGTGLHSLSVGSNSFTVDITAEDGITQQSYTVNITRTAPSSDTSLSNLNISTGSLSPLFQSSHREYSSSVPNHVSSITITASANHSGATITSGTGTYPLNVGSNSFSIGVTAEDGTTTGSYNLSISRAASNDATLSSLSLSSGTLSPSFSPSTTSYTAWVSNDTSNITLGATANHPNASVSSGTGSHNLTVGPNLLSVVVTAQDGSTETYRITLTRAESSDASLSSLSLSTGSLSPAFHPNTTNYSVSVSNSVSSITLNATTNDADASITSGTGTHSLNIGANLLPILVTAEDGSTETYRITVTRAASSDASLSSLTLSEGTLSPSFQSSTTLYSAAVANHITSITVGAGTSHGQALITSGTGVHNLNVGSNIIIVAVTAQDGTTTNNYRIDVTRAASSDASLSSLTISSGSLTPSFSPSTTQYTASVGNSVSTLSIGAVTSHTGALIESGAGTFSLNVGSNVFNIQVRAQDGVSTETYRVTVTRAASSDSSLSSLGLSTGTLVPSFSSGTTEYAVSYNGDITEISLSAAASDGTASILSGTGNHSLPAGNSTINILVEAQDGSQTTYRVNVSRTASSDGTLSSLGISPGSLSTSFSPGVYSYSANLGYNSASLVVSASANHSRATIVSGTGSISLNEGVNDLTIQVQAEDGSTESYTIRVTRASPQATLNISLTAPGDETITINNPASTITQDTVLAVSINESFDSYIWYLDGSPTGLTTQSIDYSCSGLSLGTHSLLGVVVLDGAYYSKEIIFSVTN